MTAGVKPDAADAVMDRGIVPVAPVHLQRLPMRNSSGMVRARFHSADPERILGVQILYAMILDVHLRHTIVRGRQKVIIIEPNLTWSRL